MGRYGLVSDIHGNLHALCEALGFLEDRGVDRILCLGDVVGYNAHPDACLRMVRDLSIESIAGNHDLIAAHALGYERCAVRPAHSLRRTREVLGEESRRIIAALPRRRVIEDDAVMVHGGFDDPCEYVTTPRKVEANCAKMRRALPRARICFFGHTHEQGLYEIHKGSARALALGEGIELAGHDRAYFINPGSIDAARKSGPRFAELAIFDSWKSAISFHRLPYDHDRAERCAREQGYRMTAIQERIRLTLRKIGRKRDRVLACARGWRA